MEVYTTEEEQIQQLRRWLKNYAPAVLLGALLALLLSAGWRYFQAHQQKNTQAAAALYTQMMQQFDSGALDQAQQSADQLHARYPKSPYAQWGQFMLVQHAIVAQHYEKAHALLSALAQQAKPQALQQLARLRLARLLIQMKQPQEALATIRSLTDSAYQPLVSAIEGDAYWSEGQYDVARAAYQRAVAAFKAAHLPVPDALHLKLANVYVVPTEPTQKR